MANALDAFSFFAFDRPYLPHNFRSENFSRAELQMILNQWRGDNELVSYSGFAELVESLYAKHHTRKTFDLDPTVHGLRRDGLGALTEAMWSVFVLKRTIP